MASGCQWDRAKVHVRLQDGNLCASLAAPFLLPALELIQQANRPTTPLENLVASGLSATDVAASLFSPWFNRSQLYIGLAALVFVPGAFRRDRRAAAWGLAATAMLGIAVATGSPLLVLLHEWVPGFENLKYVRTHISLASFSLALLSGIGASRFLERKTMIAPWLALAVLAGLVTVWGFGSEALASAFRVPGAVGVAFGLFVAGELYRRRRLPRTVFAAALTCILLVELFSYARKYNPRTDPSAWPMFPEFPSIAFLHDDPDRFRVASLLGNYDTPFWPNTFGAYGIEDVAAYHSLLPGQIGRYMARVNRHTAGASPSAVTGEDAAGNWLSLNRFRPTTLVRLWNIKYFALPQGAPNPDPEWLELAYDGEVRLFRDRSWLPRAWLADGAIVLPDEPGISSKLLDPRFDPLRTVILNEEPLCAFGDALGSGVPPDAEPAVAIVAHEGERIALRTRSPRFNFLVLSETYYPGWVAEVDGAEVPVLKANMNFRAVPLTPGSHDVTLTYRPASFRWGVAVSAVSVALLLLSVSLPGSVGWTLGLSMPRDGWLATRIRASRRAELRTAPAHTPSSRRGEHDFDDAQKRDARWCEQQGAVVVVHRRARSSDFRIARGDARATLSTNAGTLLSIEHHGTRPRWLFHRAVIPESAEEMSLKTTPSTIVGGAFLFTTGPRRQSRAVFLDPESRVEDVPVEDESTFRVLVMRDTASPPPEGFDVVYESAREERFTDRLLAVAAELHRFETLVVMQPELPGGDGTFTERQRGLFERELERLGIREEVILD